MNSMTIASRAARWLATGPAAPVFRPAYQEVELRIWAARGKQGLIPHKVKQRIVAQYAAVYQLDTLVETGTYLGDMVWAVHRFFREIHTIELDPTLYQRAAQRFRRRQNVHVYLGDSADLIGPIVANLARPALFWLDGHYSGGITAKGKLDTPILTELNTILSDPRPHVVLIDDASDFTGRGDFPRIDELRSVALAIRPDLRFTTGENIIRIHDS